MRALPSSLPTLPPLSKVCEGVREQRGSKDSLASVEELFKSTGTKLTSNPSRLELLLQLPKALSKNTSRTQALSSDQRHLGPYGHNEPEPQTDLEITGGLLKSPTQCEHPAALVWSGISLQEQGPLTHRQKGALRAWGRCQGKRVSGTTRVCYSLAVPAAFAYSTGPLLPHGIFSGHANFWFMD